MKNIIRQFVAIVVWSYFILKVFVFDIDIYLLNTIFPDNIKLIYYKFFIIIPVIAIYWFISGNRKFFINALYIITYPIILFLWKIPEFLFKRQNWLLVFTYINSSIIFIKNLRVNFLLFSLFALATMLIVKIEIDIILYISGFILFSILVIHYVKRFKIAFSPSSVFAIEPKILNKYFENPQNEDTLFAKFLEISENEDGDSIDEGKFQQLQRLLLINRLFAFISEKLKSFQRSRIYIVFFIFVIVATLIFSVLIFGLINYALFKIEPNNYSITTNPSLINFIYYNFNSILNNNIAEIIPVSTFAKIINMIAFIIGFILIGIYISIIISVQSSKYNEDLHIIISSVDVQETRIEKHISDNYKLSIAQAISEIENIKGSLINIISYFCREVEDNNLIPADTDTKSGQRKNISE